MPRLLWIGGPVAMATARIRQAWPVIVRQRFWVLVGLAMLAGVIGHAVSRGWWAQAGNLLATWWPWLLIGISAAAVVLRLAWWLWWGLPKQQVDRLRLADPKDRGDAEDNFRKTAGQLLGGAAVLLGAGAAYLQFTQQQRGAHDLLISNQVAKGFELLGNKEKDLSQRLGGIYALEGVMNDSERYHQPVLEALCAFVRDRTRPPLADSLVGKVLKAIGAGPTQQKVYIYIIPPPPADVQAALTVIGRREAGAGSVDLHGADLPNAELSGANLIDATLSGATLSGTTLSDATLSDATLSGATLSGATLINANLFHANLFHANLSDANLSGATLSDASLSDATLFRANLSVANLSGAFLINANLFRANLSVANLSGAFLNDANLTDATLSGATLFRANLGYANLIGATLFRANLSDANLFRANLSDANLSGAENLTQGQLDGACGDEKTKLDPPLTIKPCPPPPPK